MAKKKSNQKQAAWDEAARRCRLSAEEVQMAKELGIGPASLIKNIPSASQRWKAPVRDWVRELYEKKFGKRKVDYRKTESKEPSPSGPVAAPEVTAESETDADEVPF